MLVYGALFLICVYFLTQRKSAGVVLALVGTLVLLVSSLGNLINFYRMNTGMFDGGFTLVSIVSGIGIFGHIIFGIGVATVLFELLRIKPHVIPNQATGPIEKY